jgi:hypothetical protein
MKDAVPKVELYLVERFQATLERSARARRLPAFGTTIGTFPKPPSCGQSIAATARRGFFRICEHAQRPYGAREEKGSGRFLNVDGGMISTQAVQAAP